MTLTNIYHQGQMITNSPISVVILTYNEEVNIGRCLESVVGITDDVFVVDSGSTDATLEIVRSWSAQIFHHTFEGYAAQRNWALEQLPFKYEWILYVDADERLSAELQSELCERVRAGYVGTVGYYINRRMIFNGRWIRHGGYYPMRLLRLFRRGYARCEPRSVNEHFIVSGGNVGTLTGPLLHEDLRGIDAWIDRHNRYATLEAMELLCERRGVPESGDAVEAKLWGNQVARRRWLRSRVLNRFPPLVRPFLYFTYRYLLRAGFLDGKEGFIYHFLHGLWFPFLIDVKYLELRRQSCGVVRS